MARLSIASPSPLCAQRHKHQEDIETDVSLLDERGISVTQAPKVNVVGVSKQLSVYCGAGEETQRHHNTAERNKGQPLCSDF